jgi:hypothetical protein
MFDPWGTWHWVIPDIEDPWTDQEAGWLDGWTCDYEAAKIDPRRRDGLLFGPSKGHINSDAAGEVGMFRAYGYGATMGGWFHDYVAYWAGNDGYIWHSKSQFRGPSFEGDITLFTGEVIAKNPESAWGMPTVTVKVKLANQDGVPLVEALAEVELPA